MITFHGAELNNKDCFNIAVVNTIEGAHSFGCGNKWCTSLQNKIYIYIFIRKLSKINITVTLLLLDMYNYHLISIYTNADIKRVDSASHHFHKGNALPLNVGQLQYP